MNPKEIVSHGYDRIAERYVDWSVGPGLEQREKYLALLMERLPEGAAVLELGCATGLLTTRRLAERFRVTGVDISARQIQLARKNVPQARFIHADMTALKFPPASFDAITAFYCMTHVPREEHAGLLKAIAGWLRPGGLLVATMGSRSTEGAVEDDWLGAPMYFSHYDSETNERLVRESGLEILQAREETENEDGVPVTFLWVVAERPQELA